MKKYTLILILIALTTAVYAQDTVRISGTVTQTGGNPVRGATITIPPNVIVRSDQEGKYSFTIPKGKYTILVEAAGFEVHAETLTTGDDTGMQLDFILRPAHLKFEETVIGRDESTPEISVSAPTTVVKPRDENRAPSVLGAVTSVPGVAVLGQGGLFQVPSVRGASRERTILMLESVRVTSERRTGPSFSFVDPLLLESLSITRGPAPVIYGSNGESGLIHATVIQPFTGPPTGELRAGYQGNSNENWQTFTFRSGSEKFQYSLGGGRRESGDFESGDEQEYQSGYTRINLFGKARYVTDAGSLTFLVLPSWTDDIEKASSDAITRPTLYPEERHQVYMVDWQDSNLDNGWAYQAQGWYHPNSLITQDDSVIDGVITSRAVVYNDTDDYGLRFRIGRKIVENWTVWSGIDFFERTNISAKQDSFVASGSGFDLTESFYSIRDGGYRDAGLFFIGNADYGKLLMNAGVRIQNVKTSNHATTDVSDSENSWSGNFGVSYAFNEHFEGLFNVGRGIRPATISEKFFTGATGRGTVAGNPNLTTESNIEVDGGVRYRTGNWFAGFYVFHNNIEDFIARVRIADGSFTFSNQPEVSITGIEGEGHYRWNDSLRLYGNFHVMNAKDQADADVNDIPPSRLIAGVEYDHNRFWNGAFEVVGQFEKTDPGPDELEREGALILNMRVGFRPLENLQFRVVGFNLTNKTYFDSADNRAPHAIGRSFGVEVIKGF